MSITLNTLPALLSRQFSQMSDTDVVGLDHLAGRKRKDFTVIVFETADGTITWRSVGQTAPKGRILGIATVVCRQEQLHRFVPVAVATDSDAVSQMLVKKHGHAWEPHTLRSYSDGPQFVHAHSNSPA